jgi:hypothetical protein
VSVKPRRLRRRSGLIVIVADPSVPRPLRLSKLARRRSNVSRLVGSAAAWRGVMPDSAGTGLVAASAFQAVDPALHGGSHRWVVEGECLRSGTGRGKAPRMDVASILGNDPSPIDRPHQDRNGPIHSALAHSLDVQPGPGQVEVRPDDLVPVVQGVHLDPRVVPLAPVVAVERSPRGAGVGEFQRGGAGYQGLALPGG